MSVDIELMQPNPTATPVFLCCSPSGTDLVNNGHFTEPDNLDNLASFSSDFPKYTLNGGDDYSYSGETGGDCAWDSDIDNMLLIGDNSPLVLCEWSNHSSIDGSYFIMVEADASKNIWRQTYTVTPNTWYQYVFDVCNLDIEDSHTQQFHYIPGISVIMNTDVQTLDYLLNGTETQSQILTLPRSNTNSWIRVCEFWYSGSNSTVTFKINSNVNGQWHGNNIGLDAISFSNVIPVNVSLPNQQICFGQTAYISYNEQTFSYSNLSVGLHNITETFVDQNNCVTKLLISIDVKSLPVITCTPITTCLNNPAFTLTACSPSGGTYSGLTNNIFNPSIVGVGSHILTYTYANQYGCINTASTQVIVLPAPTVTFSGNDPICSGQGATICANPINGTAPYTYLWFGYNTNQCISTWQWDCSGPDPCNSFPYSVSVTDANGCTTTGSTIITINPVPIATVTPQPDICNGATTNITPSSNVPGTTYSWTFTQSGVSGASSGIGTFIHDVLTTTGNTSGSVTYTITPLANGCQGTPVQVTITVNPAITLDLQQTPDCWTTYINATPATGLDYSWNIVLSNGVNYPYLYNQSYFAGNLGQEATFSVTATNSATGCSATDEIIAGPHIQPIANAGSDISKCANDPAVHLYSGINPDYTYSWSPSGGLSATNIPNPLANPNTTTSYTLTVTDAIGCTAIDYVLVTVNPVPIFTLGSNQSICKDDPITLTAYDGITYQWSNGATTPSITVSPTQLTVYSVLVTNNYNCTATDDIGIYVKPLPTVQVADISICQSASGTLSANVSGGISPYSYLWSNGSLTSSTSVNTGGLYTVTVTGSNGCMETDQALANTVLPPPVPQIIETQTCLADGATSSFSYSVPIGTINNFNQSWNFGDGTAAGSNPTHTFASHGHNSISLTLSNQCGSTTICKPVFVNPNACVCDLIFDVTTDQPITSSTFFSTVQKINCTITIPSGSSVTISQDQWFGPKGRIIIEHDATLIINPSVKLTTYPGLCKYMWQGIEVHGNNLLPSTDAQQGILNMLGQGHEVITIENAHIGVLLGARNNLTCSLPFKPFNLSKAGGVVKARNVNFINNGIDVKFLPKKERDDVQCLFTGCKFQCTTPLSDNYYSSSNSLPYPNSHNPWTGAANAQQRTYTGIFAERINDQTQFVTTCEFDNLVYGIKSFDTKFNVELNTSFNNVAIGISLDNPTINLNSHIINNCKFTNIYNQGDILKPSAIYINAGTNDRIWGNTFGIDGPNTQTNHILGIFANNSSGFNIYDNKFYSFSTGIRVNNSGASGQIGPFTVSDERNEFYNCRTSVSTSSGNPSLQTFCNDFTNVTGYSYNKTMLNSGTLVAQGNSGRPTGNWFFSSLKDVKSQTSSYKYFVNTDFTSIPQLMPNVDIVPPKAYPMFTSVSYNASNCLVSKYSASISQNTAWLGSMLTTLNILKQQYNAMLQNLDHGNTLTLLQAISNNMPGGQLKNLLQINSPLSDTVLISVIIKSPALAPGIFKEIMSTNLPVSDKVEPYLLAKLSSLPPGIAKQILSMNSFNPGVTTPASLQMQINSTEHERNVILSNLINLLLDNNQRSDALQVLENETTLESRQLLAATYIVDTNLIAASAKLNSIQPLNQDVADWLALYNMLYELAVLHKSMYDMDSTQLQLVRNLAYQIDDNLARANARGILSLLFNEEFTYEEENITARYMRNDIEVPVFSDNIKYAEYLGDNFPNPFGEFTNIPYYLNEGRSGTINVYDARGMLLQSLEAKEGENIIELKTKNYASGIYFYSLVIDGETIEWKKMILVK